MAELYTYLSVNYRHIYVCTVSVLCSSRKCNHSEQQSSAVYVNSFHYLYYIQCPLVTPNTAVSQWLNTPTKPIGWLSLTEHTQHPDWLKYVVCCASEMFPPSCPFLYVNSFANHAFECDQASDTSHRKAGVFCLRSHHVHGQVINPSSTELNSLSKPLKPQHKGHRISQ